MTDHPASLPIEKLLAQCEIRRQRRGGPGGQHRNKVETAVIITHQPTGISAEANERRSQAENQSQALFRLRVKLAVEFRSPAAEKFALSELWQSRQQDGRLVVSESHADFPALLAEALDALAAVEYDMTIAADRLGVTASQLAKFLRREPTAWQHVNESRRTRGLRPLK
jgi:hypothetical protein